MKQIKLFYGDRRQGSAVGSRCGNAGNVLDLDLGGGSLGEFS